MYTMIFQQNIGFGGCNPFMMGCYNPRLNFFLGMAAGFASSSVWTGYGSSMATPYMSAASNPFLMTTNPYAYQVPVFNYQAPTFNYQMPTFNFQIPTFNYTNPFGTLTATASTSTASSSSSSQGNSGSTASDDVVNTNGRRLNKRQGYGKEFLDKVKAIAKRVNCDYRDLLAIMNSESGISTTAVNRNGGATGLIQFMPKTAQGLGTTTEALRRMTPVQQLDYVEKYIVQNKRMAGFSANERLSGGQLYSLIFLPARAKREVLTTSGEVYYNANRALDTNKDGEITRAELDARVRSHYVSDNSFLA